VAYTEVGTRSDTAGYGVAAFNFKASVQIEVTDLGFFSLNIGGGDTPTVRLWNVTTNSILATTPNLQPSLTGDGWYYYTLPTAVTLNTTDTYQVTAPIYWVPTYPAAGAFTYAPEIISPAFVNSGGGWGGWTQPAAPVASPEPGAVATGANFKYNVVPEPSAALFVLSGVGALLMFRRHRR
jgi:hypothetical protein